jgi:hypothetical protein
MMGEKIVVVVVGRGYWWWRLAWMMLYDRHTPPSMHLHYEDHYLRTTNSHRARTYVRTHTRTVAVTANLNGVTATFCATLNISFDSFLY